MFTSVPAIADIGAARLFTDLAISATSLGGAYSVEFKSPKSILQLGILFSDRYGRLEPFRKVAGRGWFS